MRKTGVAANENQNGVNTNTKTTMLFFLARAEYVSRSFMTRFVQP
jgi:hypothetical protein